MRETVLAEVAQRSPTSPETNLESRAMQVRVPWTQAWLCTKDFRRKCTGAGVAAKSRFPAMQPSEVRQGLTSTKLGLKSHWTVGVTWTESLDSRDLARRAERRPKGPVMQLFGACGCRGKIPSTHGRFLRSFWCREEADYPHSMHKQENSREGGRISVTELQYSSLLLCCRFAGFQRGQQSIPYQKVKREMQRNSAELMHSLSKVSPETETLNSQKRGFGYLGERIG
ncbi:hypothetical protein NDU88_003477 [Pleurodeles waltl]|uniref:Uncharacterized protein n=1 Tax=Pleurodeles waltl TaxID=8319 RepID=A0AAV7PH10_PLEWA|nr:hypothetical protein NDU88_003477 [Pleurodeles waltl]